MRIAQVIGRTVHTVQDPALVGGRFLIVSPLDAAQMTDCCEKSQVPSAQASVVVYDNLGAGLGDIVGISEGAEATAPFANPIPIDALTIAIFDKIHYQP